MDVENHDNMENVQRKEEENLPSEGITEIEIPYALYQYLSSEQCNLESLCRICLSTGNEIMYPLLSTKENSLLAVMFTDLTSVQLPDDDLPSNICQLCQTQVIQCYEFKNKCLKSACLLKSIIKNEFIAKEEPNVDSMVLNQESQSHNADEKTLKEETDIVLDVEYLEDLSDEAKGTLEVIQNTKKRKKRKKSVYITDSNKLLSEVASEKKRVETKTYKCSVCSKKFSKGKIYRAHVSSNCCSVQCPHPCGQCKESFESEHDLRLHATVHYKGPVWTCIMCHKEYDGRAAFRRHVRRHMAGKRHACAACGKRFSERYALRRHAHVHSGLPRAAPHACHLCDKRYSESGLLAAHVARHAGLRPCACAACGKAFPSPRLLASHMLVHSDDKPYACRYCEKRFRHESTRNTHHRTHTGERPYVCSACGKCFIQNSNLTLHMRTHTGERPYSCSLCERKFSSGSALKAHERVHNGERAYSCKICGKKFSQLNLKAHMRVHAQARPHACSACPKTFLSAARLRDHCRIHTGEKPFECTICSRKCATKNHLAKHIKSHQLKDKRDTFEMKNVESLRHTNVMYKQYKDSAPNEFVADKESKEIIISAVPFEVAHEVPLEVTGELILQDDSNVNTEYVVVDNSQNNYQSDDIYINTDGIKIVNEGISDSDHVNLATMNEGEVSFATSNVEGTTVKLYQLDQSLVQIHSSGGQVTISQISSKMTANF